MPAPPFDGRDLSSVEVMIDLSCDVSGSSESRRTAIPSKQDVAS